MIVQIDRFVGPAISNEEPGQENGPKFRANHFGPKSATNAFDFKPRFLAGSSQSGRTKCKRLKIFSMKMKLLKDIKRCH